MKNKAKQLLLTACVLVFWLALWQIAAMLVGNSYFLPGIPETLSALGELLISEAFFKKVFYTFLRVISGLAMGIIFGAVLAVLSNRFPIIKRFISPIITVIKSTPVATFIIILWVLMNGNFLAIFIAFLMVMPIIWQNLSDAYKSINIELLELCDVFEFSFSKKIRLLVLPALAKYFVPAVITSTGLAWKSEIAAEIIAYTKNSIGQGINDAKGNFDTPTVFAWTLLIILFSIALEKLTKFILNKSKNNKQAAAVQI